MEDKCKEIIEGVDWSSSSNKFKIAVSVLTDDYEKATEVMLEIGKEGSICKEDYMDWPLFQEFRKSEEFLKTFEELFGETSVLIGEE